MTKTKVVYASNGGKIGAGYRQAHVEDLPDGTQVLSFMTDDKTGSYSPVVLKAAEPVPVDPDAVDPTPVPEPVDPTPVDGGQLLDAIRAAEGGEVLEASGVVNDLVLYGLQFDDPVTIKGATIKTLAVNACKGIVFKDCLFDYEFQQAHTIDHQPFYVTGSEQITFSNCDFDGDNGSNGYGSGWGLFSSYCDGVTVENCKVHNFLRGIKIVEGANSVVTNNDVFGISGDGMNFSEVSGVLIEGNHVHDFRSDPSASFHKDMIQFWSYGNDNPSTDITIRNNVLDIGAGAWTQSLFMRNEAVDSQGGTQQMFYQDVLIEGNVIKNAHVHGITIGETNNLNIRGNHLERKLDPSDPANEGWGENYLESVPKILVYGQNLGTISVSGNTAPIIDLLDPSWDDGGNTVTGA